jgi:hypothetical protein
MATHTQSYDTSSLYAWRGVAIQHYVINFVSDLRQVGFSTNKTDRHDIADILLKVALNTINLNQPSILIYIF